MSLCQSSRMFLRLFAVLIGLSSCATAELAIDLAKKNIETKLMKKFRANVVAQPHYKVGNPIKLQVNGIILNVICATIIPNCIMVWRPVCR